MIKNYIKIAFRNLFRQKGYTLINISGLSVGLTCCLLVFLYVRHEVTYDKFHFNADRLYRVAKERVAGERVSASARSQVPMGPAIEQQFSDVREAIRFWDAFQPVVGRENTFFNEEGNLYFADPEVFSAFSFPLVQGNPETVLNQPGSVVLSESAARKYFGTQQAVGNTLEYRGYPAGELTLTVTGIMGDLPTNTHFSFDMLVSMQGVTTEQDNWGSHKPIWTYLWLQDGADVASIEARLPGFLDSRYESSAETKKVVLEPIADVHLYSKYEGGFTAGSSVSYIYLLVAVGLFLLVIACINFMNLATARSFTRATEVGIRKSFGAQRSSLIGQFIGEAFLLVLFALTLALVMAEMLLPVVQSLTGKELHLNILGDPALLASLVLLTLIVSLGAGLYPALYLSGFNAVGVLRNRSISQGGAAALRKGLVVFQFAISVVLIMATVVAMKQMDYIRGKELGFNEEQIVVLPYSENEEPLLNRFRQHPEIRSVSTSQRVPVNTINSDGRTVRLEENTDRPIQVESYIIDDQFLPTYGIDLVAGRNISEELASDSSAFLINEAAVTTFGWPTPGEALGKRLTWSGQKEGRIVGVVKNFNMGSMHDAIQPLVMTMMPESTWWQTFISVKFTPADLPSMLQFLESTWKEYNPQGAYEYFFIDESLEQLHRKDLKLARLFGYVSALAIFIACLGLFGLVSYMAVQRKKEVAVRKVLGASIANILVLFNKEFLKLVLAGFVVAVPVAWYGMNQWLNNFAYRIDIGLEIIFIAGLAVILVAACVVSLQTVRAALADPVKSLRSE